MQFCPVTPQLLIQQHLEQNDNALLFVGMGIGKSAAVLHRLTELFLCGDAVGALIVAPLRVATLTWPMEKDRWDQFRWMKAVSLRTEYGQRCFLNGSAHLYLCNYEFIPTLVSLVERRKGTVPFDCVVWDESTRAKNPSSKRINLYRRKVPRVKRNYLLTGTPAPNSTLDIFAQVRLCDDGERLGRVWTEFKKTYFFAPAHQFAQWKPKADTEKTIQEKISDITITLKSSDWLDIPDTITEDVEIEFPKNLRKQYETLEEELVIELRKDKVMNVANAAALVTKLLQFTSGHIYDENREVHPIHDLKFEALKKIVAAEKSVLVAFIFKHEEARLREHFPHARFFSDAKKPEDQKRLIDDWNAGKIKILVGHPASISHGLNLQYGGYVIAWISLTYNREWYDQLPARLARRGQENITKVYRLMVENTVDWAVAGALEAKAENEARLISALQLLESFRNK